MDKRPKTIVFLSSVIGGFEGHRDAAANGATKAGARVLRAEEFKSPASSPRNACLDGVSACDVVVLILGRRYGWIAPSGKSATEEEYEQAKKLAKRIVVFVEECEVEEAEQTLFIQRVSAYVGGHWRRRFSDAESLESMVHDALIGDDAVFSSEPNQRSRGRLDRAVANTPAKRDDVTWIQCAWTTLRNEDILDPLDLDQPQFFQELCALGHEGAPALFDYRMGKSHEAHANRLRVAQSHDQSMGSFAAPSVIVDVATGGTLSIWQSVGGTKNSSTADSFLDSFFVDPKDMRVQLAAAWQFTSKWWDSVDPHERHDSLEYVAILHHLGMRNFGEPERSPGGGVTLPNLMGNADRTFAAYDEPRRLARGELRNSDNEIKRIVAMLERRVKR